MKARKGPSPKAPDGYIDSRQIAERMQKSLRTIDRWRSAGLIPYHKMGKFVYFKWDEVQKQIDELTKVQIVNTMIKNQSPF